MWGMAYFPANIDFQMNIISNNTRKKNFDILFYDWQLQTCKINPGVYFHIYNGKSYELHVNGQIIWVCYQGKRNWQGKMKDTRWIVNLTETWICKNFHDNFIEQWMARPSKWKELFLEVPNHMNQHNWWEIQSYMLLMTKWKYPQQNLCISMMASFASCIHYKGMTREAVSIIQCAGELYHATTSFHNTVLKACKGYTLVHSR